MVSECTKRKSFDIIILPKNNYLYGLDYYKKKDTNIYISNGLGNRDINFRLFNKPSINFYRINRLGQPS